MVATADVPAAPLQWSEEADLTWTFDGSNYGASEPLTVNYRAAGPADAQPFLLVHGFGASGFHWRRNINVLAAAGYRVYAIDLLGFGLSSKPLIEYDAAIWRDQCAAFLEEVAGCGQGKKAIVAGNSIGGYTTLSLGASCPHLVLGVASLNGAGRFSPSPEQAAAEAELAAQRAQRNAAQVWLDDLLEQLGAAVARAAAYAGLLITKQPARIRQVLRQVYTVDPDAADDELVASIQYPAEDARGLAPPNAIPEVFYRIVTRNAGGGAVPVDELVAQLDQQVPLLLLWGERDPWIVSAMGDRLETCARALGKDVQRVSVNAGHCPMDEAPQAVNAALLDFAARLAPAMR